MIMRTRPGPQSRQQCRGRDTGRNGASPVRKRPARDDWRRKASLFGARFAGALPLTLAVCFAVAAVAGPEALRPLAGVLAVRKRILSV